MYHEPAFYLPRTLAELSDSDKTYSEEELLNASSHIIVLAEPGAGKSELMNSLARKLVTHVIEANEFRHCEVIEPCSSLVIDGFDELAKIDSSGIHALLAKVQRVKPARVVVSSRSSEWSESSTIKFGKRLNTQPLVVRLCEFSYEEQRVLFLHRYPGEDFEDFVKEVRRFDLGMLLANPQFLDMLAAAYSQGGKHFTSRGAIFEQSVIYQASERNIEIVHSPESLSVEQTRELSSAIFAQLLLSGAEGVAMTQPVITRVYPYLYSLVASAPSPKGVLASRLFKPGSHADQHKPVHKIIAEYCAADYLCKRIANPADPLSLRKCLSVIAPGSFVRDELRGLLGWMASLSSVIQHDIIRLDPYAVLANGDPSRLEHSARLQLIQQLESLERSEPFFRRSDTWRRFSVAGFFTPEIIDVIRPLLVTPGEGHLRDLLLELLDGASEVVSVTDILSSLLCDRSLAQHTRILAARCLLSLKHFDFGQRLTLLIREASPISLKIASEIISGTNLQSYTCDYLADFLNVCARLYPDHREDFLTISSGHYFIAPFIESLPVEFVPLLLDKLADGLACVCHKARYECYCRHGISKIVGTLLDRYVITCPSPYNPVRFWRWVENLNFHNALSTERSAAVRVLQQDPVLRRGIYCHVLVGQKDYAAIGDLLNNFFRFAYYSHSGLCFTEGDYEYVLVMAYERGNTALWRNLFPYHVHHLQNKAKEANPLRQLCRAQAQADDLFMREWARAERSDIAIWQPDPKYARKMKRNNKRSEAARKTYLQYITDNRDDILQGKRWDLLDRFARTLLSQPDKITELYGDESLVRQSLLNCLQHISTRVPDLHTLAEYNIQNQTYSAENTFFAACLLLFEQEGSLEQIDPVLLRTLRTHSKHAYGEKYQHKCDALTAEIDRLIFPGGHGTETFLLEYLEPQLVKGAPYPPINFIQTNSIFAPICGRIATEWLDRINTLRLSDITQLFRIACQERPLKALSEIVARRCAAYQTQWPERTDDSTLEELRLFWLIRAFYFLPDCPPEYWQWIVADKGNLARLKSLSGRLNHGEGDSWASLTPPMIKDILEGFIGYLYPADQPAHSEAYEEDTECVDERRFLYDSIYAFGATDPAVAVPVIRDLIKDCRMWPLVPELKNMLATLERESMLRDYAPPTPIDITAMLNRDEVITVEGLRETILTSLEEYQRHVQHSEFNSLKRFYPGGARLGEEDSTEIITEWLNTRLQPQSISVIKEHEVNDEKRADFSATRMYGGKRLLLMAEVKGQWNKELYTAAEEQLYNRYSVTPDAGLQGIYIALWFGKDEKVAGVKRHTIMSATQLKEAITDKLSASLRKQIDVFVLDLSLPSVPVRS